MINGLLITPGFLGLDQLLYGAFKKRVANLDHYYDRQNNVIFKFILRLNVPFLSQFISNRYYKRLTASLNKAYDIVVIVNPEALPLAYLDRIKKSSKKTVIYFWDGSVTKPKIKLYSGLDGVSIYSFDRNDCEKYGFHYLPLFIPEDSSPSNISNKNIDLCFVASCHYQRLSLAEELYKLSLLYGYTAEIRVSASSVLHFYYFRMLSLIKGYKIELFSSALNHQDYLAVLARSKVVVDMISDPNQSGVSLRTFEALSKNCKLLTNNQSLKNENFFDHNLIAFYSTLPSKIDIDSLLDKNKPEFNGDLFEINRFVDSLLY